MNIGTLAPLLERFDYDRANLLDQEIHDALVELAAWRDLADDMGCDTPQEMEDHIDNLQDHQCKNHEDYGDLKEFFDDCVSSLNAHWPAAEVYDQNLRAVIMNAITRGDTVDES